VHPKHTDNEMASELLLLLMLPATCEAAIFDGILCNFSELLFTCFCEIRIIKKYGIKNILKNKS
jgi:hypothetical protein